MSKFNRKKIAVTLAFASLFGSKTSAVNTSKSGVKIPQTLGAVGGRINSKINSAKSKKSLPVWAKGLIFVGGVVGGFSVTAEAYNEIIALARGEKPKTLLTGRYSITELVRSRNKKQKPNDKSDKKDQEKENTKKGFGKGEYFSENTQKFKEQFQGNQKSIKSFEKFQNQVLSLGFNGILEKNIIKNSDNLNARDVPKDDETLRQVLKSACDVISGQAPIVVVKCNNRYMHIKSSAGNFEIFPGVDGNGFQLTDYVSEKDFVFIDETL